MYIRIYNIIHGLASAYHPLVVAQPVPQERNLCRERKRERGKLGRNKQGKKKDAA